MGELGRRLKALEDEVQDLRELVDGQESWSHRKRLHTIDKSLWGEALVREALDELRAAHRSKWAQLREWGSFAVAAVALVIALIVKVHGG